MAQENSQRLEWIITKYGETRINQLLSPSDENNVNSNKIRICSMDIGSGPTNPETTFSAEKIETQQGLFNKINPNPIPIVEKGVATHRENTVYFRAVIDENICGHNICEYALYEEAPDGSLQMFACGVGAPLFKPLVEDGYLMTIDYTLFIESINLLNVYDCIELNPNNEFLKEIDVDNMYRTILYVEGNLAEQIGNNTRLIGMDRTKELNHLINQHKLNLHSSTISNYFSSFVNSVKDISNILGFWSFHYTNTHGVSNNIKDFSNATNNLSTNSLLSTYKQEYLGSLSSLKFEQNDSYYMEYVPQAEKITNTIELGRVINPSISGKCAYDTNLKIWKLEDGSGYTEDDFFNNICNYYLPAKSFEVDSSTITIPEYITNVLKGEEIVEVRSPKIGSGAFAPHTWTFNVTNEKWENECGTSYSIDEFKNKIVYYEGQPSKGNIIYAYTDNEPKSSDIIILTGKHFNLIDWVYNEDTSKYMCIDSPFTFMAVLKHNSNDEDNTLFAQSDYYTGLHNFEIIKTKDNGIELTLYDTHKDNYIKFKTIDNIIPASTYSIVLSYNPNYDERYVYDSRFASAKILINGKKYSMTKEDSATGTYSGMKNNIIDTTSYISNYKNNMKIKEKNINSQVCLMCMIKEELDLEIMKCNSLVLNSLCGQNVYFKI